MNKKKNPWVLYTSILLLALSLLFGVFWCLYVYVIGPLIEEAEKISIPTSDIPWKWILVIVIGLLIIWLVWYFWEVISKKTYGVKQKIVTAWTSRPKKFPLWARWFVGLAITGVILWFLWPSIGLRFYFGGSDAASIATNNRPMQRTTSSSQQYSKLNISGSNDMKKGVWKKFSIRRDGDPLWFTPAIAQGDTLTYYFKKVEDETRSWAVQAWIDSNGEPVEKHITSDEPYPEAQLGECLVSTDKDVVVVVEVKKK